MQRKSTLLPLAVGLLAAAVAAPAHAILVSKAAFQAKGGDLNAIEATIGRAFKSRQARAFVAPFDATARAGIACTGTWLGNEGDFGWFLTAAECLPNGNATRFPVYNQRFDLGGALVAEGDGWAYVPPDRVGSYRTSTNIALVKLRLSSPWADWAHVTRPLLYDGLDDSGQATHFAGHGIWGVGETHVGHAAMPPLGLARRVYGSSVATARDAGRFELDMAGFDDERFPEREALPDYSDMGAAWWQQHAAGYWTIAAVTSNAGTRSAYGVRISKRASWIQSLVPGVQKLSDRMTVTESNPFVSRNHQDDVGGRPVSYVIPTGQAGVEGPRVPTVWGFLAQSTITVQARDRITGTTRQLVLRGQRESGCGASSMEDVSVCFNTAPGQQRSTGILTLRFEESDNAGMPSGVWEAKFDVAAVGHNYRQAFPVFVSVRTTTRAQVTASTPWVSPNYGTLLAKGAAYYVVPPQAKAQGPTKLSWSYGDTTPRYSTIRVTTLDALSLHEREVVLRAHRTTDCPTLTYMENPIRCSAFAPAGPLTVTFHAADNPDLPEGIWRGEVLVQVKGSEELDFNEYIELGVRIDTLK